MSVDFDLTSQLPIRFSAFFKHFRRNLSIMRQYIGFKKVYDSVKRKILYNVLIAFGVPIKVVPLITTCLS
jgi:hypothetical protein